MQDEDTTMRLIRALSGAANCWNGIAEVRLRDMKELGQGFEMKEGETLETMCYEVSLFRTPETGAMLPKECNGKKVFYHICNGKEKYKIFVPSD